MPKIKKKNPTRSSKKTSEIQLIHIRYVIIGCALLVIFALANMPTTQMLTADLNTAVLGDEQTREEWKQKWKEGKVEEQKKFEERIREKELMREEWKKKEEAKKFLNNASPAKGAIEMHKTKTETLTPEGLKIKMRQEGMKQETKIEMTDDQNIKTTVETDGTPKIEAEDKGVKLKYKKEHDEVVKKAEDEKGQEVNLPENEFKNLEKIVEDRLEEKGLEVTQTNDNKVVFKQKNVAAVSDFPLSVNPATKQLIVTTPAGQKIVTVLPEQAVQNLLSTGVVNSVEKQNIDTTGEQQLDPTTEIVKLETKDDVLIYKVKGKKKHNMLGFIPVTVPVTISVSANTGAPIEKEQPVFANIVDFLSP